MSNEEYTPIKSRARSKPLSLSLLLVDNLLDSFPNGFGMTIPTHIHNNPVRYVARLASPVFPTGYPRDGNLQRTTAFVISISQEGSEEDERFWVSCIGEGGKILAGEMAYTLKAAMDFPMTEFPIENLEWFQVP